MRIIINNSSQQPIYEQIVCEIKELISSGELLPGTMLPSVRSLANELKISALTVKKAYDLLEETGFVNTVHGKGSFVSQENNNIMEEQIKKDIEQDILEIIGRSRRAKVPDEELLELFRLLLEDV